jgi:Holliday junction resolvase RusA-like endonuclease
MKYIIHITPQPASRPSPSVYRGKVRMVNKPKYAKYKNTLSFLCRGKTTIINGRRVVGVDIPKLDYYRLDMDFYFPYPKSTPKKRLIEGYPMRKLPDWDNCAKALQDAIVQAKIIKDDNQLSGGRTDQWYTTEPVGRIEFTLHTFNEEEWLNKIN